MLMTIEKPKDKGKIDANTIRLDPVDRSDEVVPTTDRVVKARIVRRAERAAGLCQRHEESQRCVVATDFGRDSWR